jgi:hypothetical protein
VSRDLEGERSPWKERAIIRWKRLVVATDSSVEKGLEIGASAGTELNSSPGNGRWGSARIPGAGVAAVSGFARSSSELGVHRSATSVAAEYAW